MDSSPNQRWLEVHTDNRGFLFEILRVEGGEYPIGQVYMTSCRPRVIKAWHYHSNQMDRMVCLSGTGKIVCFKPKALKHEVSEFFVDGTRPSLVTIPKGYYHGFMNLSHQKDMHIVNLPDKLYNYDLPDESRFKYDEFNHLYEWEACPHG